MAVESETSPGGSAGRQGALWGARADEWAEIQEPAARQLYTTLLAALEPLDDRALLDVGCGAGLFCALAAERGARVTGVDAAEPLLAVGRRRTPAGRFVVADMESLPFDDGAFDVTTALNAFHYADDPVRGLREAARVTRPGGRLAIATWDASAESQAAAYLRALEPLAPQPQGRRPLGALRLSEPGVVERLTEEAGLRCGTWHSVDAPFIYPDLETALRGLLSAGPAQAAVGHSGEDAVREAIAEAIAPFRNVFDGYRMENRFRYTMIEP